MSEIRTIDAYIAEVRAHLAPLGASQRDEVLAELESLLRADAERAGEAAALEAVGDPETYAAGVLEALHDDADDAEAAGQPTPQGTVLGMPYDFRGMSVDRIGSRVWNPADPRIFMPRMFGLGWTFNLGAIAVKLGLIRPDDVGEDSYERIPPVALAVAVAVPALLAVAATAVLLVAWPMLPAEVPTHWGVSGAPDDWGSRDVVLSILLAFAVVPAALTYRMILRRRTSARSRLLSAAALAMEAVLVLGIAVLTVLDANGGASGNWMWLVVLGVLVVPFFMLYVPMRRGLHAEWREVVPSDGEGD
jgi:hypothetical protein